MTGWADWSTMVWDLVSMTDLGGANVLARFGLAGLASVPIRLLEGDLSAAEALDYARILRDLGQEWEGRELVRLVLATLRGPAAIGGEAH
jgi:hypothetical protein